MIGRIRAVKSDRSDSSGEMNHLLWESTARYMILSIVDESSRKWYHCVALDEGSIVVLLLFL